MNFRDKISYLFIFVAMTCIVGCGDGRPTRVPVSGLVTVDGEPLTVGSIQFYPAGGGRRSNATIGSDGRFEMRTYEKGDGLPIGDYSVVIVASKSVSDTHHKWLAPKKYSQADTTDLSATIAAETDQMNFDLKWADSGTSRKKPYVEAM